jgi:hypothetical protein
VLIIRGRFAAEGGYETRTPRTPEGQHEEAELSNSTCVVSWTVFLRKHPPPVTVELPSGTAHCPEVLDESV